MSTGAFFSYCQFPHSPFISPTTPFCRTSTTTTLLRECFSLPVRKYLKPAAPNGGRNTGCLFVNALITIQKTKEALR